MKESSVKLQKIGGVSALYGAIAFLMAIIFFLLIIDYPSLTEQTDKIEMIIDKKLMFTFMYLISYVVFGFSLVVLSLAVRERLLKTNSKFVNISTIYGIIWATLLIGSGMVFITGIKVTVDMYTVNQVEATTIFTAIETVSLGLGFAYGEIMGGLWILTISIIALNGKAFQKGLNYLGIVIGGIGILSIIPALNEIGGLFGVLLIVWFVWIGILLLKQKQLEIK